MAKRGPVARLREKMRKNWYDVRYPYDYREQFEPIDPQVAKCYLDRLDKIEDSLLRRTLNVLLQVAAHSKAAQEWLQRRKLTKWYDIFSQCGFSPQEFIAALNRFGVRSANYIEGEERYAIDWNRIKWHPSLFLICGHDKLTLRVRWRVVLDCVRGHVEG